MRVTTSQQFHASLDAFQRHATDAIQWQQRISSGVRFDRISEGIAAAGRATELGALQARLGFLRGNQDAAQTNNDQLEAYLGNMHELLDDVYEKSIQARNDALGPDSLAALAAPVDMAYQALEALANRLDASGHELFTREPARYVEIEPGVQVAMNASRAEVLGSNDEVLAAVRSLRDTLLAGKVPAAGQVIAVQDATTRVSMAESRIGVDGARIQHARDALGAHDLALASERSRLLDTDVAQGAAELARSQALLEAARNIFSKLNTIGLFQVMN